MRLTLPYPPTANLYWRIWRGRPVMSAEARAYKRHAGLMAVAYRVKPLDGPVSVRVKVFRPAKRGDLDNALKVLLDSLNGIAWLDDSQVEEIHATRHEDKDEPRVELEVVGLRASRQK